MKTIVPMSASTAALALSVGGDVGGNGQVAVIEVESDGGQFPFTEVTRTATGFKLAIVGTWEFDEFVAALVQAYSELRGPR